MGTDLIVKEVNFNGATLVAVLGNDSKIYTGINYVLEGLGFDNRQVEYQRNKIIGDKVLSKGIQKFSYPSKDGGIQDSYCIDIKKLPLALAKINITPKMEREVPELSNKLEIYQMQCEDVLANVFIDNSKFESQIINYLQLDEDERAIIFFQERKIKKQLEQEKLLLEEKTKELEPKAKSFEKLISANNNQTMNDVAKSFKTGRTRLFEFLRNKKILMSDNVPYQKYIEQGCFVVRENTIIKGNWSENKTQTLVTAKGISLIDNLLKEVDYIIDKKRDLQKQAK